MTNEDGRMDLHRVLRHLEFRIPHLTIDHRHSPPLLHPHRLRLRLHRRRRRNHLLQNRMVPKRVQRISQPMDLPSQFRGRGKFGDCCLWLSPVNRLYSLKQRAG